MPDITFIDKPISIKQLKKIAEQRFGDMAKAVVDIDKELMALGGEMHADEEALLLDQGSKQEDLWGINLYPDLDRSEMIEFDSMINIRPSQGNKSREIEDAKIRDQVTRVVTNLIKE